MSRRLLERSPLAWLVLPAFHPPTTAAAASQSSPASQPCKPACVASQPVLQARSAAATTPPCAGMGTAEWRAAKSPAFYTRGDYMPGMNVRPLFVDRCSVVSFGKQVQPSLCAVVLRFTSL